MNLRRWSWKRTVGLASILCILGAAAFWIWDDQTRVRPVEQTVMDAMGEIPLGDIDLSDGPLLDPVALVNQALAQHPELGPLELVIWNAKKPPRGFRRRLTPDWGYGPDEQPYYNWGPSVLNVATRSSSQLNDSERRMLTELSLSNLVLAAKLSYPASSGSAALGQRGNVLYLVKTAGTFDPLITRDFALEGERLGDPKSDLKNSRLLSFEGSYAKLVRPNRLRVCTTKFEMDQCEMILRVEQIPTLFERLHRGWTKLRNP